MDCSTCDKPCPDTITICSACEARLVGWLREVPWLLDELEVTITRQDRVVEKQPGKSNEKPMMFNDRASDARDELLRTLRFYANAHGWQGTRNPDVYLLGQMHAIRICDPKRSRILYHDINEDVHAAKQAIDRPADKVFAGPCNTEYRGLGGTAICSADLYAREGKATVRCRECGAEHDVQARREWMLKEVRNYEADAGLMASILTGLGFKIDSSTIRKYGADNLIEVRGKSATGAAKYNIGQVLDTFAVKQEGRRRKKVSQ